MRWAVILLASTFLVAATSEQRNQIIERCQSSMGNFGATMVKACVQQDVAALDALESYSPEHAAIVDRCRRTMGTFGWSMVKACADQDIAAQRDLDQMVGP